MTTADNASGSPLKFFAGLLRGTGANLTLQPPCGCLATHLSPLSRKFHPLLHVSHEASLSVSTSPTSCLRSSSPRLSHPVPPSPTVCTEATFGAGLTVARRLTFSRWHLKFLGSNGATPAS